MSTFKKRIILRKIWVAKGLTFLSTHHPMLTEKMLYFHSLLLRRPDPLMDKLKDLEE